MASEEIAQILYRIASVLRNSGESNRADSIEADAATILSNPELLKATLFSRNYWGGSGSHVDLILSNPDSAVFKTDFAANEKYTSLLLELATEMKHQELTSVGFDYHTKRSLESTLKYYRDRV